MIEYAKYVYFQFMCSCGQSIEIYVERLSEAVAGAREKGWSIGKDKNTCPKCKGK